MRLQTGKNLFDLYLCWVTTHPAALLYNSTVLISFVDKTIVEQCCVGFLFVIIYILFMMINLFSSKHKNKMKLEFPPPSTHLYSNTLIFFNLAL
eukprot:UN02279